jgi:sigma-B regulation protein RsbU (phosphoserine phosphatase)
MKLSRSFSARLSTTILVITSMLFIISMLVVLLFSRKIIAEEAKKNAAEMLSSTSLNIIHTLDEAESTVKNVAWLVEERLEDTTYMYSITSAVVVINEEIVGSCIAFRPDYFEGKHYFAPYAYDSENDSLKTKQLGNDQYNYFKMEWFAVPFLTKKPHWSNPYFDKDGGQIMMTTYSYPIMNDKKEVIAVITADISIEWLTHQLCALNLNDNSKILLIGDKGQYISGNLPGIGFQEDVVKYEEAKKNPDFVKLIKKMTSLEKGTMTMRTGHYYSFAVYGPLYNGWSTAIITPTKNTFAKLNFMQFVIAIVSIIGLLLLFLSCLRIIKTLTQPVTEFSKAAMVMAQGDFNAQLPQIETEDEIKDLHDSFEHMQQSITHYIQELQITTATKERFESELNIARQIQLSMVPTDFPDNERYSVHALLQPAREVGGDFYDFQEKGDDVFFVIGDVSGKGVPAALVMAITRAAFRFLSGLGLTIDKMVEKINNTLSARNENSMFVTLFVGKINLNTGELYYCNAGHNPIVIRHADGHAEYLHAKSNIAVGLFENFNYEPEVIQLERGSRLILYTDGVTEAENITEAQYGEPRLLDFANQIDDKDSAKDIVDHLITDVKNFTGEATQNDDITILTISYKQD